MSKHILVEITVSDTIRLGEVEAEIEIALENADRVYAEYGRYFTDNDGRALGVRLMTEEEPV